MLPVPELTSTSPYPFVPVSLPQHDFEIETFRIPTSDVARRHWRPRQERLFRGHQLFAHHRDYSSLPTYYGDRLGAEQNCGDFHCAKDPIGRQWAQLHLRYLRTLLRGGHCPQQYGCSTRRAANSSASQARCQMLSPVSSPIQVDWASLSLMPHRLSDNARAREALRQCLPEPLRDATFSSVLRDDAATKRCLAQLLINLSDNVVEPAQGGHPGL